MNKKQKLLLLASVILFLLASGAWYEFQVHFSSPKIKKQIGEVSEIIDPEIHLHPRLRGLDEWQRPVGPLRVALQVGHWNASEAPEEQKGLRQTTGTSYGSMTEWEVALAIAKETEVILESQNIEIEILPTTIPPNYWADVFISIHADGNDNSSVSGYKVAGSRYDHTGKAETLAEALHEEYGSVTKLSEDTNITRTMKGYYAFNWRRYDHSLHPLTPAVSIETGFLTNATDRQVIVAAPEQAARGIANGVLKFLNS